MAEPWNSTPASVSGVFADERPATVEQEDFAQRSPTTAYRTSWEATTCTVRVRTVVDGATGSWSAAATDTPAASPVISISLDQASVVEGTKPTFTVTADPAPASPLTVFPKASQTGASSTRLRSVTVRA